MSKKPNLLKTYAGLLSSRIFVRFDNRPLVYVGRMFCIPTNSNQTFLSETPQSCPFKKNMSNESIQLLKGMEHTTDVVVNGQTNDPEDGLIYFNVSGKPFATTAKTLANFPNSLLGTKEQRDKLPRTKFGEIFLNRHPQVFESVITFYQTGIFEPPTYVNQNIFVLEIKYYGLEEEAIGSGLKGFDGISKPFPSRKWQAVLWNLLEYPDSSLTARIVSMISLLTIIISIVIFCWETLPEYRIDYEKLSQTKKLTVKSLDDVEIFCISYFTVEIMLRFISCPNKCLFIKNILNIIDLISILPFYVTHIFNMKGVSIYFLRAVRLVRVFRIFKLSRHSSEMKILGIAVRDSARELGVLLFFILLGVLLFSSAVYYAEGNAKETQLKSIPHSFWWSIVTMTTVGYGDDVPKTTAGRLVGAVAAMTGILVIAMPIPIIVNNFTRQYQRLKPVSKYWHELQSTKKKKLIGGKIVQGLFSVHDLNPNDLYTTSTTLLSPLPSLQSREKLYTEINMISDEMNGIEKIQIESNL